MADINTALTITGTREYTQSIRDVKNEISVLKSSMRATSEEFKNNSDSVEALKAKLIYMGLMNISCMVTKEL